jgi:hypothetical protein
VWPLLQLNTNNTGRLTLSSPFFDNLLPDSLTFNEAPRSPALAGRGIKRNYGVAKPLLKIEQKWCDNPSSLLRASPWFVSPFIPAIPLKAGQGILAKPNKKA